MKIFWDCRREIGERKEMMSLRHRKLKTGFILMGISAFALASCAGQKPASAAAPASPGLIVYTAQEKDVYEPIIKEFEERTNLTVRVETGSSEAMLRRLEEGRAETAGEKAPDWDVVFGIGAEVLEQGAEYWEPLQSAQADMIDKTFQLDGERENKKWAAFSARPLVIMYNTNVVTYRELPEGWNSLLEPRWRGRIAFGDPNRSDIYAEALAAAVEEAPEGLAEFMSNLEYKVLNDSSEVNEAIAEGRYSLGVTLEGSAQALLSAGAYIDYVYPREGTAVLLDGTAVAAGCANPAAAREFVEFTLSRDVQRILVSDLNRRSVRRDVPPRRGLSPIDRLPLVEVNFGELSERKQNILKQWNAIMDREGGGT